MAQAHENPPTRISNLTGLLAENSRDPDLYLQRGELYRLGGKWLAAEEDFARARALGADSSRVAVSLAALELDRGNPRGALGFLHQVPEVETSALFLRGRALRELGRFREAATALEQAIGASPRPRPEDFLELADAIVDQGDPFIAEALDVLDAGARRLGSAASLILAAAELEVRRGRHEAALLRLRSAPPALQESPAWRTRQGEILLHAGRDLEAQAVFTEALSLLQALPAHRRSVPASVSLEEKLRGYLRAPAEGGTR
jgi:tetratricopeptide (TPR) repeat protein